MIKNAEFFFQQSSTKILILNKDIGGFHINIGFFLFLLHLSNHTSSSKTKKAGQCTRWDRLVWHTFIAVCVLRSVLCTAQATLGDSLQDHEADCLRRFAMVHKGEVADASIELLMANCSWSVQWPSETEWKQWSQTWAETGRRLSEPPCRQRPGVPDDEKLAMSCQWPLAARKSSCILGCIQSHVGSGAREGILSLCSSLVRSHMEYCNQELYTQGAKDRIRGSNGSNQRKAGLDLMLERISLLWG